MTLITLPDGKQVSVTSDKGSIWLQVCACRGSIGIQLTRAEAIKLRSALLRAILETEKQA
jgi:hypothetical protein